MRTQHGVRRYGDKNYLNVAVGKNPDGSWAIGIANPTGIPKVSSLNGHPTHTFANATTIALELVIDDVVGLGAPRSGGGG